MYDGEENRVQQAATVNGTTTTTISYIGSLEEVATTGSSTTTTASYGSLVERVNGALYYLLGDGLGSISEVLRNGLESYAAGLERAASDWCVRVMRRSMSRIIPA